MSKKNKTPSTRFINAKITSTISITLVLVLLGVTVLVLFLGNGISTYIKENMSFSVMLESDVTDAQIQQLRRSIDGQPFIKSSRFVSKEEAKEELIKELGEDPEELLGFNPAQDAIEVFLHSEYTSNDSIAKVIGIIKENSNVGDLLYHQEALDLVNDNVSKITTILLILTGVLLFISFALIRNTIRLSVYSNRFLINTMKLVGASWGFIRKPFLRRNIWSGVLAGILANAIIYFIIIYFSREYAELSSMLSLIELGIIFSIVIFFGVVISVIATYFAVNRYLKMDTDNLYYV